MLAVPLKMHVKAHSSRPARPLFASLCEWSAPYFGLHVETTGSSVGAIRTMRDASGTYVERLVAMDELAMQFSYSIVESPLPLDQHIAHVRVQDSGGVGCIVTWDMHWCWKNEDAQGEAALVAEFSKDFLGFIATAAAGIELSRSRL
jgi:hypothetical protein